MNLAWCPDGQFGQQPADQLLRFHIVTLRSKRRTRRPAAGTPRMPRSRTGRVHHGGEYPQPLAAAPGVTLFDFLGLGNEARPLPAVLGLRFIQLCTPTACPRRKHFPRNQIVTYLRLSPDHGREHMSAYTESTALDGLTGTGWPVIPVPTRTGEP
jgi:hypothetical protein